MSSNWNEGIAKRLQTEHEALRQMTQLIREHLATTPAGSQSRWLEALKAAFERLHAHMKRSIAMKEQDGYLEVILKERPTLARQVEAINAEHGQLIRLADGIRDDLARTKPEDGMLIGDLSARILRYVAIVGQHEQKENMIVLFAFNQDLGTH